METSKEIVKKVLANNIRDSVAGSNVPDSLLFSFLDMFTNYSINNNCLVTELLVQWLEGECGFPAKQVNSILILSREQIWASAGIEVLMPGQTCPTNGKKQKIATSGDKLEWEQEERADRNDSAGDDYDLKDEIDLILDEEDTSTATN